jgi:hypothetical protein
LDDRLVIANPDDELGHLGQAFNSTLERLQDSFDQLKRFTADASHELRTPLTAIRSVGEVALQKSADAAYYRDIIGSMLEEVTIKGTISVTERSQGAKTGHPCLLIAVSYGFRVHCHDRSRASANDSCPISVVGVGNCKRIEPSFTAGAANEGSIKVQ